MNYRDLLEPLQKIGVLVALTYFASRTKAFERVVWRIPNLKDRLIMSAFFAVLAIIEVLLSPKISPLDSHIISATAAGLFGGPITGALTGVVSGLESNAVIESVGLSGLLPAILGGMLAGWISVYRSEFKLKVAGGFLTGTICHGLWLGMRFFENSLLAPPDVLVIGYVLPAMLSGVGVSLFLIMIGDIRGQRERIERSELTHALELAQDLLPHTSTGIDKQSARYICEVVSRLTGLPAVAMVSRQAVLAHIGAGSDHHRPDDPLPILAEQAISNLTDLNSTKRMEVCKRPGCRLASIAVSPLVYDGNLVGGIVMYETDSVRINHEVVQLGVQVARFIVTYQMQLAALESQEHALARAELKALQAQVHPHFLFNALTTIAGLCQVDPRQASILIVKLGEFFRSSLKSERGFLSYLQEELALVRSYLEIEQARFGDRMTVEEDIEEAALKCRLPSYSLQPLVENAALHGVSKKPGPVTIKIAARLKGDRLVCWVLDTGKGFDTSVTDWTKSNSHAIPMLYGRLMKMYGNHFGFRIRSIPGKGTVVCLWAPVMENLEHNSD